MIIDCGGRPLDLSTPQVMGILNVTPDSFSDGGLFRARERALSHAREMASQGAAIIDVGGESTRPGADPVSLAEELERVIPVIEALAAELPTIISVDTSKPEVMREAARAGAGLINDVYALRKPGALQMAAASGLPVCLMHMQGEPRGMQEAPDYNDVVREVGEFLRERRAAAIAAGIAPEGVLLDPGIGFGKRLEHNLALLRQLPELAACGAPLVVGVSRKSMFGTLLGRPVGERLHGSLAAAVLSAWQGAAVLRVHDVAATVDALKVVAAIRAASTGAN